MNFKTVRWTVLKEGRLCKREPPLVCFADKLVSAIIADGISNDPKTESPIFERSYAVDGRNTKGTLICPQINSHAFVARGTLPLDSAKGSAFGIR